MHPTLCKVLSAVGVAPIIIVAGAHARADVHETVGRSLVIVEATGQNSLGEFVGPVRETGFFVNPRGMVVTTHHIIKMLEEKDEERQIKALKFEIYYDREGVGFDKIKPFSAEPVRVLRDLDLMSLKLIKNAPPTPFPFLRRNREADAGRIDLSKKLYTSGYANGLTYTSDTGFLKQVGGPPGGGLLWQAGMMFQPSQSGSPIYLEDGSLLGIIKGSEQDWARNGYFIPIDSIALVADIYDREDTVSADDTPEQPTDFVRVVRETKSASFERNRGSIPFRDANEHCAGARRKEWTIDANPGSTVEIDSVVVKRMEAAALLNVAKESETQIKATGVLRNSGTCTDGKVDVRGLLDFKIDYTELTPIEQTTKETIARLELGDKQVKVPLMFAAASSDIKLYVEGQGVRSTSFDLGQSSAFLKQSYNATTSELTIEKKGQTGFSAASWSGPNSNNNNNRYSQLDQINTKTVGSLRPAWTFSAGALRGTDVMPLVVGNMMYVQTMYPNIVYALDLDAESKIVWKYEPKHDPNATPVVCCDPVNYGVQYADGKIVLHQADTTLITLDAKTGKELWRVVNGDPKRGQSGTGAALIVGGTVIVGIAGSEFGVRGHVTGYDLEAGKRKWRARAVGPDEDILFDPEKTTSLGKPVGKDSSLKTWTGDQWKLTGGSAHGWYAYDPDLNLFYYATGNPSAGNPGERAGPNSEPFDQKWTQSILARNPDTGIAAWAYQMTPFDAWDHDAVGELILADDMMVGGKKHDALVHFDRSGSLLVLDRKTGIPLVAEAYDSANGGPGSSAPGDAGTSAEACPARAKDQQRSAYSPLTGLFFVVPSDSVCMDYESFKVEDSKPSSAETPEKRAGNLIAWNAATGKIVWGSREQVQSAIIATAGGILCFGTSDGYFKCLDQKDGAELYKLRVPSGLVGNIMTYSHRDKQYIGVYSGVGGWAGIGPSEGDGPQPHEGARNDKGESDVPKNGKDRTADGYDGLKQYSELGGTLTLLSLPDGLLLRN